MSKTQLDILLADPRLSLTHAEEATFQIMDPTEAITLIEYLIKTGQFGVDADHGPEPALTHFYQTLYALPDIPTHELN